MRYLCLVGFCMACSTLLAEPPEEKLDTILKELRALGQRVDALEARIGDLESDKSRAGQMLPKASVSPLPRVPLQPVPRPQDIFRMQIEEPGSLLKNIQERERTLRNRAFPPDLF